ncbi:MAG: protein kinase domain-containing protein [Vicinamibacterales bacterium]
MIGRTVSHYRIVSQLGTGGMGVVYGAVDTRLGRTVALKFVPEELAKDRHVVDRLRAEARAASALNHPNICTIYDIGEDDGRPFIVMELIEGQSVRDELATGPMRIRPVVDIGIQIADALDAAHTQGILHRDIKPANLILTGRRQVKILDFGLAKLLPRREASGTATETTADQLTTTGVIIGTVAYMSPEQVTGEELDGRTDLFSLGVVLYECVTGQRPFTGKTSAVVFSAILNRAPVAPVILNPETPLRLGEIINNCLEKDRELRYQDAAGLRADLKRLKRDLEPPHSEVARSVVRETDASAGSAVPKVGPATPGARASASEPSPSSGPHSRSSRLSVALTVAAAVALTAAVSYLVWSRAAPVRETSTDQAASAATIRGRLELAIASLQARSYRTALAYAEDVLRVVPDEAEAIRVRDAARGMLARFDEAVARASGMLAAGDVNGATEALETARTIDPAAPAIGELSARLVDRFRSEAEAARQRAPGARAAAPPAPGAQSPIPAEPARSPAPRQAAAEGPEAAPSPVSSPAEPSPLVPSVPAAPPASLPPPASVQPPAPATSVPPVTLAPPAPVPAETPGRDRDNGAARPPQTEDDDAAIRRVVATYARAIETKDVALFRSVKPNLSSEEQRRIEAGFRAISSQRVAITILSIIHRGAEASVRLGRRDTIDAGGRQQTVESRQTLTLIRTGTGWVIREIG